MKFAVWGLSFKPGTDDMREAPSINLIKSITESGGKIAAYDPKAIDQAKFYLEGVNVEYHSDKYSTRKCRCKYLLLNGKSLDLLTFRKCLS